MPYFSPTEILQIFEDLPNHQGWDPTALDAVERQLEIQFPPIYRKLMVLGAHRIGSFWNAGSMFVSPHEIIEATRSGQKIIDEEGFEFKLGPKQIVFAWDSYFPIFFEAIGSDAVPVCRPDPKYQDTTSPKIWLPTVYDFFVALIKSYLKL